MKIPKELEKLFFKELKKKKNVHGYSGDYMPRERDGKIIPEEQCFRIYVSQKEHLKKLRTKDVIPHRVYIGINRQEIKTDVKILPKIVNCNLIKTDIKDLKEGEDHRKKYRPCPAGVSCTHEKSTACTDTYFFKRPIGTYIFDLGGRRLLQNTRYQILIGGCNHCFGLENDAKYGEYILAPSPVDGGKVYGSIVPEAILGIFEFGVKTIFDSYNCKFRNSLLKLKRFFSILVRWLKSAPFISTQTFNYVDISFAEPLDLKDITFSIFGFNGKIIGKGEHKLGEDIYFSGRTTGIQHGPIVDPNFNYNCAGKRGNSFYKDGVLVLAKVGGGDSGSPGYTLDGIFKGCRHAGTTDGKYSIYNKIENIEKVAGVELII